MIRPAIGSRPTRAGTDNCRYKRSGFAVGGISFRSPVDANRRRPLIDGAFRPCWDRNRTDVPYFTDQVSYHPMLFANLEIFRSKSLQAAR